MCVAPATLSVYCLSHEDLEVLTFFVLVLKEHCKNIRDRGAEMQSSLITYHDSTYSVKITSKASLSTL